MLKFRPISYNEGDFRSYKYSTAAADVTEGQLCYLAASDLNTSIATPHSGTFSVAGTNIAAASILENAKTQNKFFPIYKEDPDTESISATLSGGDYVIGFYGDEWEVHKSCTESAFASSYTTVGGLIAVGSTGKYAAASGKNATDYIIAECIGTFNSTWIRMRKL